MGSWRVGHVVLDGTHALTRTDRRETKRILCTLNAGIVDDIVDMKRQGFIFTVLKGNLSDNTQTEGLILDFCLL